MNSIKQLFLKKDKNIVKVVYLKYLEPKLKKTDKCSSMMLSYWSDFTFCLPIPINAADACLNDIFKFQFVFNTSFLHHKLLLLSGLRFLHRFSNNKK